MSENRITIQLVGSAEDQGHVRLSAFIVQLEAVKAALKQTERLITGDDEPSVYYRIVDLRHSSPATVVLEAVSHTPLDVPRSKRKQRIDTADQSGATVQRFFQSLKQIQEQKQRPERADLQALEAYRNLTSTLDKSVAEVRFINTQGSVSIDLGFRNTIDEIIGPDELANGSVYGMLEKVNLHNATRFDIYPTIGPRQVACDFHPRLREDVIKSLDRYVRVSGNLRYKRLEDFPYAINAEEIEVLPDHDELPSLWDLRGAVPEITGDLTAGQFLKEIRDGDEAW